MAIPEWGLPGGNAGVAWLLAYGGVNTTTPIPAGFYANMAYASGGTKLTTATLSGQATYTVVASFGGYLSATPTGPVSWSVPGMHVRASNLWDSPTGKRTAAVSDLLLSVTSPVSYTGTPAASL